MSYSFDTSTLYKKHVDDVRRRQKEMVKNKDATYANVAWQVEGSTKKGAAITNDMAKAMLRAFNGEGDALMEQQSLTLEKNNDEIEFLAEELLRKRPSDFWKEK